MGMSKIIQPWTYREESHERDDPLECGQLSALPMRIAPGRKKMLGRKVQLLQRGLRIPDPAARLKVRRLEISLSPRPGNSAFKSPGDYDGAEFRAAPRCWHLRRGQASTGDSALTPIGGSRFSQQSEPATASGE